MTEEQVKERIKQLLSDPDNELLCDLPFTRGGDLDNDTSNTTINVGQRVRVQLPNINRKVITQTEYMKELDPMFHKVLFDDNVPSITVKLNDGDYVDLEFKKMALPFQKNIKNKQVQHLCGRPMKFTLNVTSPSEQEKTDFSTIKKYWRNRNMNGMRYKMVDAQKSVGKSGLLFYMNHKGKLKSRLLSYLDGYVLVSHDDDNGERILETVYYMSKNKEYIDSYDDKYMYRMTKGATGAKSEWVREAPVLHGFDEIPLVTKRGEVAWENGQSIIEVLEIIWNIYCVIMKRHGWGILYIKGNIIEKAKKIAGSVILQDNSGDPNSTAEFKEAPTPAGMETLIDSLINQIMVATSTTFLLPKDIKTGGDLAGITVQLIQSADNEIALQGTIEYQNVADKMLRLFTYGLGKELTAKGEDTTAVTRLPKLDASAQFEIWMPKSEAEIMNLLIGYKSNQIISGRTATENCPIASPDDIQILAQEKKDRENREDAVMEKKKTNTNNTSVEQIKNIV